MEDARNLAVGFGYQMQQHLDEAHSAKITTKVKYVGKIRMVQCITVGT